eukprot:365292-Chlamydomonas_euryale.AAC.7
MPHTRRTGTTTAAQAPQLPQQTAPYAPLPEMPHTRRTGTTHPTETGSTSSAPGTVIEMTSTTTNATMPHFMAEIPRMR